jgi:hypothetical protein
MNLAFASTQPARRSVLRQAAELVDRLLQRIVLFAFYCVPVSFALLNPFLRRSDIREAHAGFNSFANGRYAIYVLWQPTGTIPWYVRTLLEELREQEVNTIAVVNHELSTEQLSILQGLCTEVLVRSNKGSDFGAYKDAVLRLTGENKGITRLLLLNDSVYVFPQGLKKLVAELLSDDCPVVAAYECWERLYHFQSFCISLSGSVLYDPRIQEFWQRYRPISIRRWRIDRGEVGFSAALRQVSPHFKVVYGINELLDVLTAGDDWATILRYREFVPRPIRNQFPEDGILKVVQRAEPAERELLLRRLREGLSDLLMFRAQSHTGAFFFPKFLGSPFLKRDIVYRELYTVYEVERMLRDLGFAAYSASITDEIRRRGTAAHLKGLTKRRHRLGLRS